MAKADSTQQLLNPISNYLGQLQEGMHKRRGLRVGIVLCLLVTACIWLLTLRINFATLQLRGVVRFRVTAREYETAEAEKAVMPKSKMFQSISTPEALQQQLPVWVLSLARSTDRRKAIAQQLHEAGVTNFEIIDAVDGHNASAVSDEQVHKYLKTWKRHMWYKGQPKWRSKAAIDLTHFMVLERIAAKNHSAIILEDDARLTGKAWWSDLLTTLKELPEDWDLLYLNACFSTLGKPVSKHLVAVRETACTLGYIPTPAFARKALEAGRAPLQATWIDIVYALMTRHREAQAYLAQPPLAFFSTVPSTVDYGAGDVNTTWWEHLWMKGHNAGRRRLMHWLMHRKL